MEPIEYTTYIAAPRQRVWEAFISEDDVKAVWWGCALEGTLEPGRSYAYVGPGAEGPRTTHVTGEIIQFDVPSKLSMTERPGPVYNPQGDNRSSRMTFTFTPVNENVTKLSIVNDRWSAGHPGYEDTKGTWPMLLSSLKSYLETGKALPMG